MPTYSYRCTECGHAFDIQQAFTDDSLTECPNCGGSLRKVFNSIGVSFTGSGFYRNDSRPTPSAEKSSTPSPSTPSPGTPAPSTPAPSTSSASKPSASGASSAAS